MSTTKIRTSAQVMVDADFDINSKKLTGVADPSFDQDAATKKYVDTAISAASSAVHAPVADLAACKALTSSTLVDKEMMLIETLGTYRFDAQSSDTADDVLIIRPTDISSGNPGRWLRITPTLSDHNLMSGKQGGTTGEYNHLTNAEVSKLSGIESSADVTEAGNVGSTINGVSAKTTMVDADKIAIIDTEASNVLKTLSWAYVKSILKTYFDSLYNAKNTYVVRESPSGTKNGSNTDFTLAHTPTSGTEMVFKNGILQNAGAGNDYTISTNTITFLTGAIPVATDVLLVTYTY